MNNELPKTKIDERTGIEYHLEGDHYIPCLLYTSKEREVLRLQKDLKIKILIYQLEKQNILLDMI